MTSAPPNLLTVRTYVHENMGVALNKLGIVGDPAHLGGYHCGRDRIVNNDYSVYESDRDRKGLSDYASALDIGTFTNGEMNLRHFSKWLVARCERGTLDTANIREVIYSPDGETVLRWDRLRRRKTGDNSHLYHTHISYFRDSSNSTRNIDVFKLYVKEMTETMDYTDDVVKNPRQRSDSESNPTVKFGFYLDDSYQMAYDNEDAVKALTAKVDALTTKVAELSNGPTYIQLTDAQFNILVERMADNA